MESVTRAIVYIFEVSLGLILGIAWLMGFVLSGNGWCAIPFYSWYVVLEKIMYHYHLFGYAG